jgi:hypothetical protein
LVDAPSLQRRTFEVIPQLRIQPTKYAGGAFAGGAFDFSDRGPTAQGQKVTLDFVSRKNESMFLKVG